MVEAACLNAEGKTSVERKIEDVRGGGDRYVRETRCSQDKREFIHLVIQYIFIECAKC